MKATEFDKKFDDGEDMIDHVDWSQARRPNIESKRVNVDFPTWMVSGLDQQAKRLGRVGRDLQAGTGIVHFAPEQRADDELAVRGIAHDHPLGVGGFGGGDPDPAQ